MRPISHRKNIKTVALILCGFITTMVQAQEANTAAGGNASGSGGTAAYSVGQIVYSTQTGANGTVAEGVQQAYVISTLELMENAFNFSLSAFPNPTQENLHLRVGNFNQEQLSYKLIDTEGKLLNQGEILTQETDLDMRQYAVATYFVEVHHAGKKVQTFKIIKNQ